MSTTTSDLLNRANIIKNETLEGKNSAVRVGSLFWDIISKMEGNTGKLLTLEELINSGGSRYSNVRVTPVYTNGVLIATIRVGVQDYAIYAPGKGGPGSDSDGYDTDGYDDSEIRREIDLIKSNLDNILEREKAGIKDMVEEILAGKNFINGWQAGWSEILKSYLISVGVLGADGESKGWAYLDIKYRDLEAAVNRLRRLGEDNQGLYETLQARLNIFIEEDFGRLSRAVVELGSRYALTDDEQTVLQWFTAQLRTEAGLGKSLAELYAAAGDLKSTQEAIAALRVDVEDLEGRMVSKASLTTQVSNALGQLYSSGLITKSSIGEAVATLFAEGTDPFFGRIESKITTYVRDGIAGITADTQLLELIANKIVTTTDLLELVADNIVIDADDIDLEFKDFRMKDGNDRLYIHSVKDSAGRIIKFAYEVGNFQIDSTGNITGEEGDCGRYAFTNFYLDAPKIVTEHILFGTNTLPDHKSYLDFNIGATIRWFDTIGAASNGDEVGVTERGSITFSGDTITINGKLHVTGGVV